MRFDSTEPAHHIIVTLQQLCLSLRNVFVNVCFNCVITQWLVYFYWKINIQTVIKCTGVGVFGHCVVARVSNAKHLFRNVCCEHSAALRK